MAEHHTRSKTTDRLEEAISRLTQNQSTLIDAHHDLTLRLDSIQDQLLQLQLHLPPHTSPQPPPTPPHHPPYRHTLKLDLPRFDGQDAMGWIFKISQFFDYHQTLEEERIFVASFYMDGPALSWFQWMHRNHLITSWSSLLHALETRFAPTFYDDPEGTLAKLTQRGSVNDYLHEFERLANRVTGLPPSFLLSCFISGLTPELRREVQALQPVSLPQAISLAKLQEEKLEDRRRSYRP